MELCQEMYDCPLNRRRFLRGMLAAAAIGPSVLAQDAAPFTLVVGENPLHPPVPHDFIGLSYEAMQLEDPAFFSSKNLSLIEQFRLISRHGVLRLGGNTSEFSWWKENDSDAAPVRKTMPQNDGEPDPNTLFAITPVAIRELKGFLDATGWTCIYGLNLGYGTPEKDVREALYVHKTLGDRLQYFQVGNEVDLFWRHLRDPHTWNVKTYLENWLNIVRAVQGAIPRARFGMPDVASDVTWLPKIAELWEHVEDKANVVTLSHHYYFGGPPASPDVNIERLLRSDPKVEQYANITKPAADKMGVGLRMTEGNTCYQGGKPGVSDVFASALWGAEYALTLMQFGYSGVNLHGGSGHAVAVSVGGLLRGEKLMANPNLPHAKPFYTPIARDESEQTNQYRIQPVGHGLRFAGYFAGCQLLPASLTDTPRGTTVFAGRNPDGKKRIAILNKKPEALDVRLPPHRFVAMLTGASLTGSKAELKTVDVASKIESYSVRNIPAYTALLVEI